MPGIPLGFGSDYTANALFWMRIGFFWKRHSWPSVVTTLVDIDGGTVGFLRVNMQTDGRPVAEMAYKTGYAAPDLSTGIGALALDKWYWISLIWGTRAGYDAGWSYQAKMWGPGGTESGLMSADIPATAGRDTPACTLGWGESLSSFYGNFENAVGNEMASLVIDTNTGVAFGNHDVPNTGLWLPPTADIDPAALSPGTASIHPSALYLCHESVGSTAVIHDSTSNHYDLGPGDFAIVGDGPY